MKRLLFSRQFVNEAGNDLVPGKIHTIRRSYYFWKNYEGQDVALAYWTGKPYRSKQKVFCVKRLVSVQLIRKDTLHTDTSTETVFFACHGVRKDRRLNANLLSENDGFGDIRDFYKWFSDYPDRCLTILHFTEFWYANKV